MISVKNGTRSRATNQSSIRIAASSILRDISQSRHTNSNKDVRL